MLVKRLSKNPSFKTLLLSCWEMQRSKEKRDRNSNLHLSVHSTSMDLSWENNKDAFYDDCTAQVPLKTMSNEGECKNVFPSRKTVSCGIST